MKMKQTLNGKPCMAVGDGEIYEKMKSCAKGKFQRGIVECIAEDGYVVGYKVISGPWATKNNTSIRNVVKRIKPN